MNHFVTKPTGWIAFILGILLAGGCIGHYKKTPSPDTDQIYHGKASWYGPGFHGKLSASGEPYDMWALTAAHRTLPFGTWVQVQKVGSEEKLRVRINDRGPFIKGRIIDLSYAAARELKMIGEGTAEVILTILENRENSDSSQENSQHFWVQAGPFISIREAMILREKLAQDYPYVRVKSVNLPSGEWHRVQIGSFDSIQNAQTIARSLKNDWGVQTTVIISK